MNWNSFYGVICDMDNAYMESLGVCLADMSESEVFDAWPALLGYSL
jgi:hypothetical protein